MRVNVVVALVAASAGSVSAQPLVVEQQKPVTDARLQAVSVPNSKVVWASGAKGTYVVSQDGGATWKAAVVPGADSLEFRDVHAFDARRAVLLAAGPGDKSRIYRTGDGGANWALVWKNADPKGFYDCFDFRGDVGVLMGDALNGKLPLLRTEDAGRTWKSYTPPGYQKLVAEDGEGGFAASGTCLAMSPDGAIWVGTAKTGRAIRFGAMGTASFATPIVKDAPGAGITSIAFRTPRMGIAGGGDLAKPNDFTDNVILTSDGGRNWTLGGRPTFPGGVYGLAWVPGRPTAVVAVGPKGAAWSNDGGKSWQALDGNDYWGIGFGPGGTGWIAGPAGRIAKVR